MGRAIFEFLNTQALAAERGGDMVCLCGGPGTGKSFLLLALALCLLQKGKLVLYLRKKDQVAGHREDDYYFHPQVHTELELATPKAPIFVIVDSNQHFPPPVFPFKIDTERHIVVYSVRSIDTSNTGETVSARVYLSGGFTEVRTRASLPIKMLRICSRPNMVCGCITIRAWPCRPPRDR